MERFNWASAIWLTMALVLPASALIGRKLNWKKGIVMALAWAAIFAVTAAVFSAVRG